MFNRLMIFIQTFRREVLPYHLHRVTDWLADSSPMCPSACHSNNLIVTRVRKAAQEWKQLSIKLSTIPFRSTFCLPTGEWWARDVCTLLCPIQFVLVRARVGKMFVWRRWWFSAEMYSVRRMLWIVWYLRVDTHFTCCLVSLCSSSTG